MSDEHPLLPSLCFSTERDDGYDGWNVQNFDSPEEAIAEFQAARAYEQQHYPWDSGTELVASLPVELDGDQLVLFGKPLEEWVLVPKDRVQPHTHDWENCAQCMAVYECSNDDCAEYCRGNQNYDKRTPADRVRMRPYECWGHEWPICTDHMCVQKWLGIERPIRIHDNDPIAINALARATLDTTPSMK